MHRCVLAAWGAWVTRALGMSRDGTLPGGLANLSDRVRVVDRDGTNLGYMIVAAAQKLASEQGGELFVTGREGPLTVVVVRKAPAP